MTQWQLGGDADGPAWQQDTARAAFLRKLKGIAQAANVNATFGLPDTSGAGFQVQSSPLGRASARDIVIHHIAARKLGRRVDKQKLTRLSRLLIDRQIDGVGGLLLARPPSERWFAADRAHPELLLARSINSFLGPAPHLTTISESVQVFQHQGKTVFAVWHDLNTKPVELYPGRDAQAWDLLGNPIPLGGPGNQITKSTYKIMAAVSREPYFVTGVDTPWLNTQLSARWTPATVASQSGEQKLTLQITNHFPERRRFVFRFRLPDGIKTSAREHSLVLESGQQGSLKIKINVYTSAYAGVSQAELFTHVLKDDESRFFRRLIPLEVQSVLGVKAQVKGRSLLISATNTTGETLNLAMRVQLSGGLREAWAIDFPPNSTRSRELAVDNAAELVGQKVEISLRDSSSGRFLRTQVVVE